jgi:hypothetical protein
MFDNLRPSLGRSTMMRKLTVWWLLAAVALAAADWPQFRGVNATGVAEENDLPVAFNPEQNVVWKTPLPRG